MSSVVPTTGTRLYPGKRNGHVFSLVPSGTAHYFLAVYDLSTLNAASISSLESSSVVVAVLAFSFYSVG